MQRGEMILAGILTLIIVAGTGYETFRGAGKTAEIVYLRNQTIPYDAPLNANSANAVLSSATAERPRILGTPVSELSLLLPTTPFSPDPLMTFLNHASEKQLIAVSGIGPALANRIIQERARVGVFFHVQQILDIDGIGDAKLKKLREHLQVSYRIHDATVDRILPTRTIPISAPGNLWRPNVVPVATPTVPVLSGTKDLNLATKEDLMTISGIGELTAETILQARRAVGGFKSWEDVDKIPGIGEKRLSQMQVHFFIRGQNRSIPQKK